LKITSVTATPASTAAINGPWPVESAISAPPQKFFRRVLYLRFNTGGAADRIIIDETASTFDAVFQPREYNTRVAGPLAAPQFSLGQGSSLIFKLGAPLQFTKVVLSPDISSAIDYNMEFHRLDGNTLSDKATLTANVQKNIALLSTDANQGFIDARFAVFLKKKDGAQVVLNTNQISELHVMSYPASARVGIADPDDLSSPVFFWRGVGEFKSATSVKQVDAGVGLNMAKELQRHLDARLAESLDALSKGTLQALPDHIVIALVIESDAPCAFNITSLNVNYRLVLESFPSREGKQVLRFDGKQLSAQEVSFKLPGGAVIESATLKTVESFRGDRPATIAGSVSLELLESRKVGAHLSAERWVAQHTNLRRPLSASGLGLAVMAIADGTELQVELHDEREGKPSGHKLAAGTITLEQIGPPVWAMVLFPEPVILTSQPHWVLVKTTSGSAVWLTRDSMNSARTLEESSQTRTFIELSTLEGQGALFQFFSPNSELQTQPPATIMLEKIPLTVKTSQEGAKTFDLRFALTEWLKNKGVGKTLTVTLVFTSALAGLITVYPPRIEYSI
jgi:hypothetical protein